MSLKNKGEILTTKIKFTPIQQKEKEKKSNLLNTVTTEHIAQTTQSTNKSEQNKEQGVNNIITRMGKRITTACREQEKVITDQLCYGCGSKEHEIQKCNKKNNIFVRVNERQKMKEE